MRVDYMISIADITKKIEEEQIRNSELRFKNLHLSELAICGLKYRHSYDNRITIPFKWLFEIGNAFEYALFRKMKSIDNSLISQYPVYLSSEDINAVGHLDAYSVKHNVVYEFKASKSDSYMDIYLRQIKAYMIVGNISSGKLFKYNIYNDKLSEFEVILDKSDEVDFNININAFLNNEYIKGIENSLCSFCENLNCPANKNIKGVFK